MEGRIRLCVSSPPDRENLVVEFFFGEEQWAELNQEGGNLNLEIYPKRSGEPWKFAFEDIIEVLKEGKSRLLER